MHVVRQLKNYCLSASIIRHPWCRALPSPTSCRVTEVLSNHLWQRCLFVRVPSLPFRVRAFVFLMAGSKFILLFFWIAVIFFFLRSQRTKPHTGIFKCNPSTVTPLLYNYNVDQYGTIIRYCMQFRKIHYGKKLHVSSTSVTLKNSQRISMSPIWRSRESGHPGNEIIGRGAKKTPSRTIQKLLLAGHRRRFASRCVELVSELHRSAVYRTYTITGVSRSLFRLRKSLIRNRSYCV